MADLSSSELTNKIYQWAFQEMRFRPQGKYSNSKLPTEENFKRICRGPTIDVWKYIIRHVYSAQTVQKVKGNLALNSAQYKVEFNGDVKYCEELNSLHQQKVKLSAEVSHLLKDIRYLENDQKRIQQDLINTESEYETSANKMRDSRRKAMLLHIYSEKCTLESAQCDEFSNRLAAKAEKMFSKTRRKSAEEVYYAKESEGRKGSESEIETACCKSVRESCTTAGKFLHDVLQGSFGKDRKVFHQRKDQLWTSIEKVLSEYPIGQVIQALMVTTQDSIITIRENTVSIDIKKDAGKLQFKYENTGALVDLSSGGKALKGLYELQMDCQSKHLQRFFETEKNQNDVWSLSQHGEVIMSKIERLLKKQFDRKPTELELARKVIETKVDLSGLKAALSAYHSEGKKLQPSVEKATKQAELLMLKYRKIQDFKSLAEKKQQLIRLLARQNSDAFNRLATQRSEILQYVGKNLSGHREEIPSVVERTSGSINREVEKFASLYLPYLLYIWIDSVTKVASLDMSLHQVNRGEKTTAGKTLLQTLAALKYPLFKAPEYVLLRCVEVKGEIEEMECLIQYHNNQSHLLTQLQGGDKDCFTHMNELCERVEEHDRYQLDKVLPLLNQRIDRATRGLADCLQLKDTVRDWWELPAQYTIPWVKIDDKNIQQWRDKWTVLSTRIRQSKT